MRGWENGKISVLYRQKYKKIIIERKKTLANHTVSITYKDNNRINETILKWAKQLNRSFSKDNIQRTIRRHEEMSNIISQQEFISIINQ